MTKNAAIDFMAISGVEELEMAGQSVEELILLTGCLCLVRVIGFHLVFMLKGPYEAMPKHLSHITKAGDS